MTMSTLVFSLIDLVLPLKWLSGKHHAPKSTAFRANRWPASMTRAVADLPATGIGSVVPDRCRLKTQTPLRVIQVIEHGQPSGNVGRMVISGRMSDVCAELDRLVAREAA